MLLVPALVLSGLLMTVLTHMPCDQQLSPTLWTQPKTRDHGMGTEGDGTWTCREWLEGIYVLPT